MTEITESMLNTLREEIRSSMSEKRFRHTAEVEQMAIRLGELYAPHKIPMLRGAALLHDLTKEYSKDHHLMICAQKNIPLTKEDVHAPKTLHARTAEALIPDRFPAFASEELLSCVRWHTTGRRGMTLCEKLIYLADYIDETRKFPDCVKLREMFWSAEPRKMNEKEKEAHLRRVLIESYKMTVTALLDEGCPISPDTVDALNELIIEERKNENGRKD